LMKRLTQTSIDLKIKKLHPTHINFNRFHLTNLIKSTIQLQILL